MNSISEESDAVNIHYAQGSNPDRFTMSPFKSSSSPYYNTHVPPEMGYRVLQLVRDRTALRQWGFTFCRHDFGGACLVHDIEPCSPADAAVSILDYNSKCNWISSSSNSASYILSSLGYSICWVLNNLNKTLIPPNIQFF